MQKPVFLPTYEESIFKALGELRKHGFINAHQWPNKVIKPKELTRDDLTALAKAEEKRRKKNFKRLKNRG